METIPKVGIIVGIVAIIILTPIFAIATFAQHQEYFEFIFLDTSKIKEEIKTSESYKNFLDRYPDAIVNEDNNRHHHQIELLSYSNITGNQLRLSVGYDMWDKQLRQHADCDVRDRDLRDKLDAISGAELKIPSYFYKEGNANDMFVSEFIKYTNCLELGETDANPPEVLKTSHYIAIPEGTGIPGCEETNECFNPYSLDVKVGEVVEWQNFDTAAHTVTSGDPEDGPANDFDTGLFLSQESFQIKFDTVGTYDYFCMVHPWQTGKIIVHENE